MVVGWTDPEGSRSHIGALLLGYYTHDGRLHYAGRAGTGMNEKELKRLAGVLALLQVPKMPLAEPPPRDSRFGCRELMQPGEPDAPPDAGLPDDSREPGRPVARHPGPSR